MQQPGKDKDTVSAISADMQEDNKTREIVMSSEDVDHVDAKYFEAEKRINALNGLFAEHGEIETPTMLTRKNLNNQLLQQSSQRRNVVSRHSTSRSVRSVTSTKEIANIVRGLDRHKGSSQRQFEAWKKTKWGEGAVDGVQLDPDDFDLEVFGDVIIPSRGEVYHHFKRSFAEAYNYFTNESYLRVKGSLWNWYLESMRSIPRFIRSQFEGEELTFWQLLLGLIKIIASLLHLILTISGIKLLMTVFDKPLLLKINYLPNLTHPKTRYTDPRYGSRTSTPKVRTPPRIISTS